MQRWEGRGVGKKECWQRFIKSRKNCCNNFNTILFSLCVFYEAEERENKLVGSCLSQSRICSLALIFNVQTNKILQNMYVITGLVYGGPRRKLFGCQLFPFLRAFSEPTVRGGRSPGVRFPMH